MKKIFINNPEQTSTRNRCQNNTHEDKPQWMLVEEAIRIQGLDKEIQNLASGITRNLGQEPETGDYQAQPPEPRPCGMSQDAYRRLQAQGENCVEKVEAMYQRNVASRKAREANAALTLPPRTFSPKMPTEKSTLHQKGEAKSPSTSPVPSESAKGVFLYNLKNGEFTWRLQLFAFETNSGAKIPRLHFQPWKPGGGGRLVSCGPKLGFSLSLGEATKLISALQKALAMTQSGEFDPSASGNFLPRRK